MKGKALLEFHEGVRLKAYKDTEGFWTIGIGHLLDDPKNDKWEGHTISLAECRRLFDQDFAEHLVDLDKGAPWSKSLDEVRRYVLLDMTYNMSVEPFDGDGIRDWPMFCRQIRNGEWLDAARNMRSTKWATQVKSRAIRLARMIETGNWPNEAGVPHIS